MWNNAGVLSLLWCFSGVTYESDIYISLSLSLSLERERERERERENAQGTWVGRLMNYV